MADNFQYTPGAGGTGASDDVGGVHYPRVKLALGPDGTANDAVAGAGVVGTGVQRVTVATDDALHTKVGEVQASPTANTLLARLKTVGDLLVSGIKLAADSPGVTALGPTTAVLSVPVIVGATDVISRSHLIADSDGAQSDAALLTVSAGTRIVITQCSVKADPNNSASVTVRVGFGASAVPAASLAGTAGIVLHGEFAPGGGHQAGNGTGILALGADGEDLRITSDDPAGGNIFVTYSYYTIAA